MSDNPVLANAATSPTPVRRLPAFRLVPARDLMENAAWIQQVLFGRGGRFEMHPVSGHIRYEQPKKLQREDKRRYLALPPTREAATLAAKTFLSNRHDALTRGQARPLPVIPPPTWLRHYGTYLVRNDHHDQPDHWLCKFQVEIEIAGQTSIPVLGASIDLRIGEAATDAGLEPNYEVVGFYSRWRAVSDQYTVGAFVPRETQPHVHGADASAGAGEGKEHVHLDASTRLTYLLSDESDPQSNLVPYDATVSGEHHVSILPASDDSLWIEFHVGVERGSYAIQAVVMAGRGSYQAAWGYWDPYAAAELGAGVDLAEDYEGDGDDSAIPPPAPPVAAPPSAMKGTAKRPVVKGVAANLTKVETGATGQVHVAELRLPEGVWEVALRVHDATLNNFIARRISLNIAAPAPSDVPPGAAPSPVA